MPSEELLSLGFSKQLAVPIIAALPSFELRGDFTVAIYLFHLAWYYYLPLAIIVNLWPVPFILFFLDSTSRLLGKTVLFSKMLKWVYERTRRQSRVVERYKRIGLVLFVAVPLPVTGAWTGSLVAVLFGLKFKYALLSIFIGIFIAGVIVTCLSLLGWAGAVIAGIGLSCLAISGLWRVSR